MTDMYFRWLKIGFNTWMLGVESSTVIALRTTKVLLGGDRSGREANLMVSEKMKAAMELQTAFWFGRLGSDPTEAIGKVVNSYSHRVRANRRRLTRSRTA